MEVNGTFGSAGLFHDFVQTRVMKSFMREDSKRRIQDAFTGRLGIARRLFLYADDLPSFFRPTGQSDTASKFKLVT